MQTEILGPLAAFGSSITWAWASLGYSKLAKHNSAFAVSFTRSMFGFPMFVVTTLLVGQISDFYKVTFSHLGWFALSTFSSYGFADALFLSSTRSLGVPGALAITSTYPIWTALFGYFFKSETLVPLQLLGLGITIVGVITVVLTTPARNEKTNRKDIATGICFAMATSILWAVNGFAIANGTLGISIPVANVLRLISGVVMTPLFAKILLPRAPLTMTKADVKFGAKYFMVEAFFGSMFFTYGLAHSPLAIGATLSSLAPVVSVPMAWVLKTEKVTINRTLGILAVVLGLAFLVGGR
ncbi:MAG: hypothetical protein A4S09_02630 [Proteobacteria bacterium SG_bin7]|nr:MAG: hypothetical protein A4S09_02630 [Proteobacteria bacterium SG_bin7]